MAREALRLQSYGSGHCEVDWSEKSGVSRCQSGLSVHARGSPDATREAFASGWFDTGDLSVLDPAGFLTLVGRRNDLIIASGFNVHRRSSSVSSTIVPAFAGPLYFGVPDDRKGESLIAVIVRGDSSLDEDHVFAFLSERLIDYQRPGKFASWTPCRATRWARCCGVSYGP